VKTTSKQTAIALAVILLGAHAQADSLTFRSDLQKAGHGPSAKPSYTIGAVASVGELWVFSPTSYPIVEAGRLHFQNLGKQANVLVGGYLSYWTVPHQTYVEPFSIWQLTMGNTKVNSKLAAYAPLGHGEWQTFGEANVSWPLANGLTAGPAADWWLTEKQKPSFGLGAALTYRASHVSIGVRGLARPHSQELRLEVTLF
jgi:hypothetical protein